MQGEVARFVQRGTFSFGCHPCHRRIYRDRQARCDVAHRSPAAPQEVVPTTEVDRRQHVCAIAVAEYVPKASCPIVRAVPNRTSICSSVRSRCLCGDDGRTCGPPGDIAQRVRRHSLPSLPVTQGRHCNPDRATRDTASYTRTIGTDVRQPCMPCQTVTFGSARKLQRWCW
jgi:hypothetical protein